MTSKKETRHILQPLDRAQRYSITETMAYLRVSRATIYKKIGGGTIATIKDGSRRFVPGAEIARLSCAP